MNFDVLILIVFLVCWPLAGWLFWKWDIGGYRSERENRKAKAGQK